MRFLILVMTMSSTWQQSVVPFSDRAKITFVDGSKSIPYRITFYDAGPATGNMLNNHFFPGINFYNGASYTFAEAELRYVALSPLFLEDNPRRAEFMSTTFYLLGMIYMYHAEGLGRRTIAKEHFEKAIEWNRDNHPAYLELANVYAELRSTKKATETVQHLLELNPVEDIANKARTLMNKLSPASGTDPR